MSDVFHFIFSCVLKNRQVDATTEQYLETAAFLETTFDELCDGVASDGSALPGLMLVKMCNDIFKVERLILSSFQANLAKYFDFL